MLQLILDVIQRHEIRSPEFYEAIVPYFGNRTEHFQHEFYHFARSAYDMIGFDRHATYTARDENSGSRRQQQEYETMVISSSSSSDEDEIIVLDEVRPATNSSQGSNSNSQQQPSNETAGSFAPIQGDPRTSPSSELRRVAEGLPNYPTLSPSLGPPSGHEDQNPSTSLAPYDGPSTSSGETSSFFSRLVIPDESSNSGESDGGKIEFLEMVKRPATEKKPVIVDLVASEDELQGAGDSPPREEEIDVGTTYDIPVSSDESEHENRRSQHFSADQVSSFSNSSEKRRSRRSRKELDRRHSRIFGTSPDRSSSSERSGSPSVSRRAHKKSKGKGKGKGKGKRSKHSSTVEKNQPLKFSSDEDTVSAGQTENDMDDGDDVATLREPNHPENAKRRKRKNLEMNPAHRQSKSAKFRYSAGEHTSPSSLSTSNNVEEEAGSYDITREITSLDLGRTRRYVTLGPTSQTQDDNFEDVQGPRIVRRVPPSLTIDESDMTNSDNEPLSKRFKATRRHQASDHASNVNNLLHTAAVGKAAMDKTAEDEYEVGHRDQGDLRFKLLKKKKS